MKILFLGFASLAIFIYRNYYDYCNSDGIKLLIFLIFYKMLNVYNNIKMVVRKAITNAKKWECIIYLERCLEDNIVLYEMYDIEFVKDGDVFYKCYKSDICNINNVLDYDFIIYSDKKNKIIYKEPPSDFTFNYTVSKAKIILSEMNMSLDRSVDDCVSFKVQFYCDEYNYFVVNNVLDRKFLIYFLKKHYLCRIDKSDMCLLQSYMLQIIDDNVKIITMKNNDSLEIMEDSLVLSRS